jgi:flagellar basal body-associated protein FliL
MDQRGIGLIIVLLAVVIILLLAGSGLYFSRGGQESVLEKGNDAIQQAEDLKKVFETHDRKIDTERTR